LQLNNLVGSYVEIEITGKTHIIGELVDIGLDVLVIFDGKKYLYIPLIHMHSIIKTEQVDESNLNNSDPSNIKDSSDSISYRKILNNAKGRFVEISVTGNQSIHGYITRVLNDYFIFYSPIYRTMFISLNHLKWLAPYRTNLTPYTLDDQTLPIQLSNIPISRTFEEQIKKQENKLVVFDMGNHANKIGLLHSVNNDNIIKLIKANGEPIYLKLAHIKSMHLP
jgi:hypothetical protein